MRGNISDFVDGVLGHWAKRKRPTSQCYMCPLSKYANGPTIGVRSCEKPTVMAIGESPNETPKKRNGDLKSIRKAIDNYWEDALKDPHWKRMAEAFDEIFEKLDHGKDSVYFTNVWKCTNKNDRTKRMRRETLEKCGEYLEGEIRILRPEVIVVFGKEAFHGLSWVIRNRLGLPGNALEKRLEKKGSFSKLEGKPIRISELDVSILPAFHWSRGESHSSGKKDGYRARIQKKLTQIAVETGSVKRGIAM